MKSIIEKTIYTILGGILGVLVAIISLSTDFVNYNTELFVKILLGTIGVLFSLLCIYRHKEKLSKKGDILRNETVALMTHEMRTSLTSTSWSINMILKNYSAQISEEDKKVLRDVDKSIHNTVIHTVDLLDVSLIDIGKLKISLETVDLSRIEEMTNEVIEKYKIGVDNLGIEISSNTKLDHTREMDVDTLRLHIILENLLENAIQYTKNDVSADFKKEIRVDISNTESEFKMIVSDNGIGIPEKEQAKIFEEFYRASNARKKLSSGSGIGLHMCNKYVRAHNGKISFESKEGEGSKFFITIPLKPKTLVQNP